MSVEQENVEETLEEELSEEELAQQAEYDKVFFSDDEPKGEANEDEDEEEEPEAVEPESDEVSESEATPETNSDEVNESEENPEQPATDSQGTHTIKWNGKDVAVSTEELIAMAQQGFDYTYKSQNLAQEKRQFQSELSLLERVRGGDKEALAQLSKQSGIDPLELLDINVDEIEQGNATPAQPFVSPQVKELMDVVRQDSGLYQQMQQVEDVLPRSVINVMAQDADTFYSIVNEVRSGDAEIVLPEVQKQIALLPEMDRMIVMNNPEQYKNLYLNVKQSMINAMQEQHQLDPEKGIVTPTKPKPQTKRPNPAEVVVKRSGTGTTRVEETQADSMTSDTVYNEILQRLQQQA